MKKRIAITIVSLLSCAALFANGASEGQKSAGSSTDTSKPITMKVGIGANADSALGKGVVYFCDLIEKKSGGKLKAELYASNMLGGDREMVEGVGMGTIEMANIATGTVTNFSDKFFPLDLPYVVTSRERAYSVLDGPKGKAILDSLENSGIYAMNFWELGFRDLYNVRGPVAHPNELKGLKIRVMENDIYITLINGLGAYATPMSIGEVFTALQQKTIDGHDNPIGVTLAGKFYEADKYCTASHHVYSATVSMISRQFFDSLPAEYRKWIVEADTEARDYERKLVQDEEQDAYKQWEANGGTVTQVDANEWANACKFVVDKYESRVDMDFVRELRGF